MSSGGGQSGETKYNWNPFIENMWAGSAGSPGGGLLNRAVTTLNSQYQPYPGQRVAGFNADQNTAMANIRHTASGQGAPDTAAGRQAAMELAQGKGLDANPYAAKENAYSGMNSPYFQSALKGAMGDVTDAYKQGTSADTTRMFNLSGAFGGSAHQNAVANNEGALAKQLGNLANNAYQQQYDRSAGLEDARLGRATGAYEGAAGRQLGAIPLAQGGQGLSFDASRQLMGSGDIQRSYQQALLDQAYNDWTGGQNWERNNINWMANLLGQAQGSTGITQQMGGYGGISPGAGLLGAASLYGAFK